jgi:hypothetical protein
MSCGGVVNGRKDAPQAANICLPNWMGTTRRRRLKSESRSPSLQLSLVIVAVAIAAVLFSAHGSHQS